VGRAQISHPSGVGGSIVDPSSGRSPAAPAGGLESALKKQKTGDHSGRLQYLGNSTPRETFTFGSPLGSDWKRSPSSASASSSSSASSSASSSSSASAAASSSAAAASAAELPPGSAVKSKAEQNNGGDDPQAHDGSQPTRKLHFKGLKPKAKISK
jgi:hypothetical protein